MSTESARPNEPSLRVMLVLGSVRPGRVALPITLWVHDLLSDVPDITVDFVDLMEESLPFMNEPALGDDHWYTHAHSRAWSERVSSADAIIFVAPAYGDGFSPVVRNALDYLNQEWAGKNVGLVTYGKDSKKLSRRLSGSLQAKGMTVARPLIAIADASIRVHGFDYDGDAQSTRACERMIDELRATCESAESQLIAEGVA